MTPDRCQSLIQSIQVEGKGKTADEIYSLLSIILKGAIAYGIIEKSPLAIVQHQKHVNESGTALTNAYRDLSDEYLLREGRKLNDWK